MDLTLVSQFISMTGFPIFVSITLLVYMNKMLAQWRADSQEMNTKYIDLISKILGQELELDDKTDK